MTRPRRRVAIPERLTLRGKRWRVVLAEKLPQSDDGVPGPKRGICDHAKRTIWIDATEPRAVQERTLVHEVLHALVPDGVVDMTVEERIVCGMERGLHALLASGALATYPEEAKR